MADINSIKRMERNLDKLKSDIAWMRRHNRENPITGAEEIYQNVDNQIKTIEDQLTNLKVIKGSCAGLITQWFKENWNLSLPELLHFTSFSATENSLSLQINAQYLGLDLSRALNYQENNPSHFRKFNSLASSLRNKGNIPFIGTVNEWDKNFKIHQLQAFGNHLIITLYFSKKMAQNDKLKDSLLNKFSQEIVIYLNYVRNNLDQVA